MRTSGFKKNIYDSTKTRRNVDKLYLKGLHSFCFSKLLFHRWNDILSTTPAGYDFPQSSGYANMRVALFLILEIRISILFAPKDKKNALFEYDKKQTKLVCFCLLVQLFIKNLLGIFVFIPIQPLATTITIRDKFSIQCQSATWTNIISNFVVMI